MPEPAIDVRGVSKKYCKDLKRSLRYAVADIARAMRFVAGISSSLRPDEFWALKDVSFRLERGESLGIIGDNGAGKSTLLKIIGGMRAPTEGEVRTSGRILALMEMGLGFDPALTGRENAYIYASVLGVPRDVFAPRIARVVEFAGIAEFIDAPVGTYSSGMKARLGFSVAAHLDPDILIVDEGLAVGDIHFRRKCVEQIQKFIRQGGSLLFVAHDPYLVQTVCSRCIVLEAGRVRFDGPAIEAVNLYFEMGRSREELDLHRREATADVGAALVPEPSSESPVVIDRFEAIGEHEMGIVTGAPVRIRLHCHSTREVDVTWGFSFLTSDLQTSIASCNRGLDDAPQRLKPGHNILECRIPELPLLPGNYAIRGGLGDARTLTALTLRGYSDKPDFVQVGSGGGSTRTGNWRAMLGDLIAIDVEWPVR